MSCAAMRLLENVNRELWLVLSMGLPASGHPDCARASRQFDQSGYHRTRGEEIPIEARIISVADVYDSLTSDRPYRKARAEAFA